MNPTPGPVTYGELLDLTSAHLIRAGIALAMQPPVTGRELTRTVIAYREAVHAFGDHLAAVLTAPSRSKLIDDATRESLAQGRRLKTELQQAVPVRPRGLPQDAPGSAIDSYRAAARTVRAASDLLATHLDSATGQLRSPESSPLWALGDRGPVVRRLAALVGTAAVTEPLLRRLAEHLAGRDEVLGVGLPDLTAVRDLASASLQEAAAQARGDPGAASAVEQVTVARPAVRTDDPLTEITDRVTAIRRAAWDQLRQEHPSLHTITDIARLATHIEATRFRLTAHRTAPLTSVTAPKAGAWHQVWTELRQLRGLTAPDLEVREHARAVERLITRVVRPGATDLHDRIEVNGVTAPSMDLREAEARRRLAAVLREAGDQLAGTAPWTHTTLDRLTRASELYVPAGPAEIGEGALTWNAGKPTWGAATIPPDKTRAINAAYRTLDAACAGPPTGSMHLAPEVAAAPQLT